MSPGVQVAAASNEIKDIPVGPRQSIFHLIECVFLDVTDRSGR